MNRSNFDRRNRERSFDKRLDQLIETGRQVVEGVAGNRPGKRNLGSVDRNSLSRFSNVGRWVEDKLDWLLDDDDDWMEDPLDADQRFNDFNGKKPLEAISQRISEQAEKNIYTQEIDSNINDNQWPDESTFKLDKWRRENSIEKEDSQTFSKNLNSSRRPLPRSSRRRI